MNISHLMNIQCDKTTICFFPQQQMLDLKDNPFGL